MTTPARLHLAVTTAVMSAVSAAWIVANQPAAVSAIRTTSASRATYLARARIWTDPGALSPADVLAGPARALPYSFEEATSDAGIGCGFAQRGKELGGGTAKFLCRTADGQNLRLKYWDPQSGRGNREVFAMVAASRLMWSLGFDAVPALSMNVRCDGCPENPYEGTGELRTRRYIAVVQAPWPTPVILSGSDINQGWSWKDLDAAIRSLPLGPDRSRQRMHFDALTLLGVFMQHGDRKSEQQRLYCASDVDVSAGDVIGRTGNISLTFLERAGVSACATPAVTITDVGATFGGAGRTSSDTTAAMNLEAWQQKRVFLETSGAECRGELTVSLKARGDGEGNPRVSEEGRRFLLEQLHRLSREHVRAIFEAARVNELMSRSSRASDSRVGGVDAWAAAFQDKVRQIEAQRCQ